ncbi:MAG: TetR/AcrR family transcriptional regulator [Minwuia sp.]|uniref:TetR/AcrR family transcriptional regulator n=1 Tax=Minwuia sp. TaxID=2493630 RepID=UPI003A8BC57C
MGKRAQHEMSLLVEAARLFRRKGYASTGTNEILAAAGAPRGSLYYYFPGGKEEIGARAIEEAAKQVTLTLKQLAAETASPAEFVESYAGKLAFWIGKSGFRDGCPITTTLLENVPESEAITLVGKAAFGHWRRTVEAMLARHGWPEARRPATARLILMSLNGAQLHARVEGSTAPLEDCAAELAELLKAG